MSGMYGNFVSRVLFPLHERIKGHDTVAVRKEMEKTEWWTPAQVKELQMRRLQSFLQRVNKYVPYYRALFKKLGINTLEINNLEFLQRIPFLTKEIIRANPGDLKSTNARSLSRFNTGGSTGEPLVFYIGKERISHDVAAKWRATRWWDVDIGDREIVLWGSPIELGSQDRVRSLRDRVLQTRLLPAFDMSEQSLDEFIRKIRKYKPGMLFGYPSAFSLIARHASANNIALDDIGIKVAFVTSEKLYDEQRTTISKTFGCRVANGYGGRDAGFIAHECPHGGMHITAEDILVEVVDSEGIVLPEGESGELVVTHMATADFPFIRYRTGDIGILDNKPCQCGRGLSLLREIQGRTTDFIVTRDGTVMHGLALIYVIRDLPGIEAFKVIQESTELIRVQLVKGNGYEAETEALISAGFRERLGHDVEVSFETMDVIPSEASGKFRYVVSKVH